ncbi:MAG: B3/4 domain-containing protein [Candidatus Thorarchaeota archaeon]
MAYSYIIFMRLPDIQFVGLDSNLSLALLGLDDVEIGPSRNEWNYYESDLFSTIRGSTSLDDIKDDPIFRSYRDLYWKHGMDPTKLRVSSEALLRRIVNGQNLWRISSLVDVANLVSAMHKLPIGLVDVSKCEGELQVRTAKKGEPFTRIGATEPRICTGRELVLADSTRIVCFGFATHDSDFTKVTRGTSQAYLLIYGAPEVSFDYLDSAAQKTRQMIERWVQCRLTDFQIFKNQV